MPEDFLLEENYAEVIASYLKKLNYPISDEHLKVAMMVIAELCGNDCEATHIYYDRLLCMQLEALGYRESVEWFTTTNKWYA